MSLYTDLKAEIITWTNRKDLIAETDAGIRLALRAAHNAGNFYRDLVTVAIPVSTTSGIQEVDLSAYCPGMKQIASVGPTGQDKWYDPEEITTIHNQDGWPKLDIYWGVGTKLMIRPGAASDSVTVSYYKYPTVTPMDSINSWIAEQYPDVIVLKAAASVLGAIGEQEIKSRVDGLLREAVADLISNNLLIGAR